MQYSPFCSLFLVPGAILIDLLAIFIFCVSLICEVSSLVLLALSVHMKDILDYETFFYLASLIHTIFCYSMYSRKVFFRVLG